jgi:Domain of unknown function (DUF4388)
MSEGIDSRIERAIDEFQQYLSDLLPPLVIADSMNLLLKCSPDVVAANIYAWASSQYKAGRTIPVSDYFFHAFKKIHLMGEYKLVHASDLAEFLDQLKPMVLSHCPARERDLLLQNLNHLDQIPGALSSPVEVVYRQSMIDANLESGSSTPGNEPDAVRLGLMMERIERELGTIATSGAAVTPDKRQDIISDALADAARSARMTIELDRILDHLKRFGMHASTEDVFRALGRKLPEWSLPGNPEFPITENSNLKAMRRIVSQAQDPKEMAARFHQMVRTAIERFNEGHLPQAASMFELAEKIIADKEVEQSVSDNLRRRGSEDLSIENLRKFAELPEVHAQLRKVLNFFEALQPQGLMESLRDEPRRDQRRLLLSLLEVHGDRSRTLVLELVKLPMSANVSNVESYFRRNLLYLLRRIPSRPEESQEELLQLVSSHANLTYHPFIVKEAIVCLGQFKKLKAEQKLILLMNEIESILDSPKPPSDAQELQTLLDRIATSLTLIGTTRARMALVDHALKKKPKLGDTIGRLKELSSHDLSLDHATVDHLLSALKANLPTKLFGLIIQQKDENLKSIIGSLSSTPLPRVRQALEVVARQFPESSAGQAAAKALAAVPQATPPKQVSAPAVSSLAGDLDLFGLPALFQSLADNTVTGTLSLKKPDGDVFASIVIDKGQLRSCKIGPLSGDVAFYQLFERPHPGTFQFARNVASGTDQEPLKQILPLIMEGIRRYDELQQTQAILPDHIRLKAKSSQPSTLPEEKDGLLFRELWNAVRSGATPLECEAIVQVDSYRIRRLLAHWVETGAVETKS